MRPTETNYQSLAGPKMLISVIDAGHFSFSNGCPLGIGDGDGCGTGTRANGETFTFLLDTSVHEITNFYQTALWGYLPQARHSLLEGSARRAVLRGRDDRAQRHAVS